MSEAEQQKLIALADVLLSTLGDMPAKQADTVVKNCVNAIYNDLLATPGQVETSGFRLCALGTTGLFISHKFIAKGGHSE